MGIIQFVHQNCINIYQGTILVLLYANKYYYKTNSERFLADDEAANGLAQFFSSVFVVDNGVIHSFYIRKLAS